MMEHAPFTSEYFDLRFELHTPLQKKQNNVSNITGKPQHALVSLC